MRGQRCHARWCQTHHKRGMRGTRARGDLILSLSPSARARASSSSGMVRLPLRQTGEGYVSAVTRHHTIWTHMIITLNAHCRVRFPPVCVCVCVCPAPLGTSLPYPSRGGWVVIFFFSFSFYEIITEFF